MFRLGLLLSGGARGPGVFFIIPCVDIVEIVDMRVQVFNVPPQEVRVLSVVSSTLLHDSDPDQGLGDSLRVGHHVVQSQGRHQRHRQRGRLQRLCQATCCHNAKV